MLATKKIGAYWVFSIIILNLLGCSYGLRTYNPESKIQLKILGPVMPQEYRIKVVRDDQKQDDYQVDDNGQVTFVFPVLPRYCDVYLFGYIKIKDRDPYKRKVIYVMKNGSTLKKMSYYDISGLPKEENGFSLLKIKI